VREEGAKKKGERPTIFHTLHDYNIIHPPISMIFTRRFPGGLIPLNSNFYSKPQQCDSPLIHSLQFFPFITNLFEFSFLKHLSKIKDFRNTHNIYIYIFSLCYRHIRVSRLHNNYYPV